MPYDATKGFPMIDYAHLSEYTISTGTTYEFYLFESTLRLNIPVKLSIWKSDRHHDIFAVHYPIMGNKIAWGLPHFLYKQQEIPKDLIDYVERCYSLLAFE